jgi:hypothetical protein
VRASHALAPIGWHMQSANTGLTSGFPFGSEMGAKENGLRRLFFPSG